ncbi:MAG: GHMP kinase [Candidatus Thermoplasmatota archaeon]|nr:GHMP kinase [Candidatus Thermoplasmatota archaeon]
MIISRTPLRASFCGGGTDIDGFSHNEPSGGRVVSVALDRYVYVTLNARFDDRIRVSYSSTELADSIDGVKHDLVREAMRLTGISSGVEVTTIAEIPGRGTGLGSSSSVTVGLLNAMHTFAGNNPSKEQLAEEACRIEIEALGAPIGRQDQYAASFGGANSITFGSEGVRVSPIPLSEGIQKEITSQFSLVYTGLTRSASKVLSEAPEDPEDRLSRLRKIRLQADEAAGLLESGDLQSLGELLNVAWSAKRGTSASVTNPEIDDLYDKVMEAGASGAKLLGAGSGGFLLVHGQEGLRDRLMSHLAPENRLFPVGVDLMGSTILHGNGK